MEWRRLLEETLRDLESGERGSAAVRKKNRVRKTKGGMSPHRAPCAALSRPAPEDTRLSPKSCLAAKGRCGDQSVQKKPRAECVSFRGGLFSNSPPANTTPHIPCSQFWAGLRSRAGFTHAARQPKQSKIQNLESSATQSIATKEIKYSTLTKKKDLTLPLSLASRPFGRRSHSNF